MPPDEAPNAEIAAQTTPLNLDNAAALLTRASAPAASPTPRAPDGKFTSRQQAPAVVEPAASDPAEPDPKVVDLKTGKPPEPKAEEAPAEDEADEFVEFAPEKEGEEPRRVKFDDVITAYEELPKLKSELENVRKSAPPPADYTTALQETVRARGSYLQGLKQIAQIIKPQDPPLDMLNPQHQSYDPDRYYALKSRADHDRASLAQIAEQHKQAKDLQDKETAILTNAFLAREKEVLESAWPEFKQPETRKQLAEGLMKTYGFTDKEISGIADHRQLLVIKDALELRALKAKQAEAVKVVRQKPKLVKGAARTTTDPKAASRNNALQSLRTTGSVDDAVKALKGII